MLRLPPIVLFVILVAVAVLCIIAIHRGIKKMSSTHFIVFAIIAMAGLALKLAGFDPVILLGLMDAVLILLVAFIYK